MNKAKIIGIGVVLSLLLVIFAPLTTAQADQQTIKPVKTTIRRIVKTVQTIVDTIFNWISATDDSTDDPHKDPDEPSDAESEESADIFSRCDVNADGTVDKKDETLMLALWGQESPVTIGDPDVDDDGDVDLADLAWILSAFGPCDENTREDLNNDLAVDNKDADIARAFYGQSNPNTHIDTDLDGDGTTGLGDLSILLSNISE